MTVDKVMPLIDAYYATPGNGGGGSLHIVLEDGNIKDSHLLWCIDHAQTVGDAEGARLGRILLQMSKTQRRKIVRGICQ